VMLTRRKPSGLLRLLLRAPIALYRMGLGGLLGGRFLLLSHVGRKTGKTRQALVEVMRHDQESDRYIVASGWGERSDWLRNVQRAPEVTLVVGRRKPTLS
jgi:deazaflavin-dependent oxidoreductase (nitroreductase family)